MTSLNALLRAALALAMPAAALSYAAWPAPHVEADLLVTGRVSQANGSPIVGADVGAPTLRYGGSTDEQGRYQFRIPAARRAATFLLRARAIGYVPATREITTTADSVVADFTLERDNLRLDDLIVTGVAPDPTRKGGSVFVLTGQVLTDSTRQPIPGAVVSAPRLVLEARADSGGRFRLVVPRASLKGSLAVIALATGYIPRETTLATKEDSVVLKFRLRPDTTLCRRSPPG